MQKLTDKQFNEFGKLAAAILAENKVWRCGQGFFNALCKISPEIAEQVRGTNFDPFYDNAKIGLFFRQILTDEDFGKLLPIFRKGA